MNNKNIIDKAIEENAHLSHHGHHLNKLSSALNMLESECEPLKFEVFMSFVGMVADGKLKEFGPDDVMLHAMMEWDLA
ncbi:hypothetical protein N9878_01115 [bacterium]|nr:hypothetical protein [bacterium]